MLTFLKSLMKIEEGGFGALGSDFLMVFNKKLKGNWSPEDPELSGAISLLLLIRTCKDKRGGGYGALGSNFFIVFNKNM